VSAFPSFAHIWLTVACVESEKLNPPPPTTTTAVLFITKTNSGGTDDVWFYDVKADGWSLDDKRQPLLPEEKLGPFAEVTDEERPKNNLPDVLRRWADREGTERSRKRTEQSFCVPKSEIAANGYALSLNRYKEVEHEQVEHRDPKEILAEHWKLEEEIQLGMKELEAML
jgi:type I restriction enzyme M protein